MSILRQQPVMRFGETDNLGGMSVDATQDLRTSAPRGDAGLAHSTFQLTSVSDMVLLLCPQTNGKLERYHQTLKGNMNHVPYEMPSDMEAAIAAFVGYYNHRFYHKALGNVTPSDVLRGRREDILRRRSRTGAASASVWNEVKVQTIERRRQHNRGLRELTRPP